MKIVNYNHDFGELVLFTSNKYHPVHRWYQLVEGFSSELVRRIIGEQETLPQVCLDPFGGIGTTALTCQEIGIKCISFENNPFFYNLARTKLRTDYNHVEFQSHINNFEEYLKVVKIKPELPNIETETLFESKGKERWVFNTPVANGIFDILSKIKTMDVKCSAYKGLFEAALASILVPVSNVFRNGKCLSYKANWGNNTTTRKEVHRKFLDICKNIYLVDIKTLQRNKPLIHNYVNLRLGDTRNLVNEIKDNSIDIVITSPPYLNSRDYADIYRLELWVLGYVSTYEEERKLRRSAIRSHVQTTWEDCDYPKIKELEIFMEHINSLNGKLWNRNIPNMIKGYFADMQAMFGKMKPKLKKGTKLYINIANSAYGNKVCEVDVIIAKIAKQLGYTPLEIREIRHVKSSRQQKEVNKLRESIVVLEC